MSWAWKIGTFRGIAVYVHATFLLLIGWLLFLHALSGHGPGTTLSGILLILLVFVCVVLHEFGHALTAQRFGIETRDITLYPIGGVARMQRIPRNPWQELLIAIAGPAVNVGIAGVLALLLLASGQPVGPESILTIGGNPLPKLMWLNLMLVAFNLLPAFPMDGGRVLRALLATRIEYGRATQIAATIGQGMAFLFVFAGLMGMGNVLLFFIAFFVYMGAAQEAATVQAELAFRGVPARAAMMTRFTTLRPSDPLSYATEALLAGAQHDFPVMEDGRVVGILTRSALIEALGSSGPAGSVGESMRPAPRPVRPDESLEETFQRLREDEVQTIPVVDGDRLVGLITVENIGEFLMIREAIDHAPSRRPGRGVAETPDAGQAGRESQGEGYARVRRVV